LRRKIVSPTPREIFNNAMHFESPGRTLATLGGIWPSAIERWHDEGLPAEIQTVPQIIEHFGLQPHIWTGPRAETFTWPHFEREVVAEDAETITYVNATGVVQRDFKIDAYKSMPHFESYPIKGPEDWAAYRERLQWTPERVGADWEKQKEQFRASDAPVIVDMDKVGGLYGGLRDIIGVEAISYLYYDEPEMVQEMMDTLVALFERLVEALFTDYTPDAICLYEDMAYKNGPLVSVDHVRDWMVPRYKRMVAAAKRAGVPLVLLDSDGNVEKLIPLWLEAGIDGVVPMEVQAGMDVAEYGVEYPTLRMMGGVDKKALAAGGEKLDAEMEKIARAVERGGYVPFFDHGLPHDVPYAHFVEYVGRLKEVTGQA
jgi:uroporphyrinogen decarboxylase